MPIPLATLFVILALVLFLMAGFQVSIAGHTLGWQWLAFACLCLAWLSGGSLVH